MHSKQPEAPPNNNKKNVVVSIVLTESTTSFLKLNAPHLDHFHPNNSKVCLITANDSKKLMLPQENQRASTSQNLRSSESNNSNEGGVLNKISSDLALFSKKISSSSSCLYDDLSNNDLSAQKSSVEFEEVQTKNWPLLTVRSMAHTDKLEVVSNDIYVSLLEDESITSSDFICRICHGTDSQEALLTPCRCRGSIALVHLKCLERWLKESCHSRCELCQHRFQIIREPKYSLAKSILMYLRSPGEHYKEILLDILAFAIYTPTAIASTYMLLMICESLIKNNMEMYSTLSAHIVAATAVFGMAAIDITYSSWIIYIFQKHYNSWRDWYLSMSNLKLVLSKVKQQAKKRRHKANNQ